MENLNNAIKNCKKCVILSENRSQVVVENITSKENIIFLGEAPGEKEDLLGIPFVGRSGKFLRSTIENIKTSINSTIEVNYLNIVKCRPPKNRRPKIEEINNCSFWLDIQCNLTNAKIICGLGRSVFESIVKDNNLNKSNLLKMHNRIFRLKNRYYIFTFHPSFIIRGGGIKSPYYSFFKESIEASFNFFSDNHNKIEGYV